jgi:hypothetical protein
LVRRLKQLMRRPGMNSAHSSTLVSRHAGLDARIAAERCRPAPDEALLNRLKKQKLRIKEMLAGL